MLELGLRLHRTYQNDPEYKTNKYIDITKELVMEFININEKLFLDFLNKKINETKLTERQNVCITKL